MSTISPPPEERLGGAMTPEHVSSFQASFDKEPRYRQAMNAVCTTPVSKIAQSRRKVVEISHTFSHHLEEGKATAQMASGRCWMFAALNVLRAKARKNMNLDEEFELSQN